MINYRRSAVLRRIALARALATETPGFIDEAAFIDGAPGLLRHASEVDVPRGAPYFVRGWAIDLGRTRIPWAIRVEIDGAPVSARIRAGESRPDIARRFRSKDVLQSGFTAFVETIALAPGPHNLRVRAVVGRLGTAFARIPGDVRFFVAERLSTANAPRSPALLPGDSFALDPIHMALKGGILAINGHIRDGERRRFVRVAAQIDDDAWQLGWIKAPSVPSETGVGFGIRLSLDTVSGGEHRLRIAAQYGDGAWAALGGDRRLIVASPPEEPSPWRRMIDDGGVAEIVGPGDAPAARIAHYRVRSNQFVEGRLRRATPIGLPLRLFARDAGGHDTTIPAWSARTADPNVVAFGAEIAADALPPGTYRMFVDADDATHRFVGRADTQCDLVVARRPTRASERSSA